MRLAPNVLVSITSAPALRYSPWTSTTSSGWVRLSDSKQRLMKTPLPYSIVPMAPSQTSTRSSNALRKGFIEGCNITDGRLGRIVQCECDLRERDLPCSDGRLLVRRGRNQQLRLVPHEVVLAV